MRIRFGGMTKAWFIAVAAVVLVFAPAASATIQLTLSSGGSTLIVNDGDVGDVNPLVGWVTYVGAVGNWYMNVTTGKVGTNPLIDLNSIDQLAGSGTGTNALTLMFSGTDFSGPAGAFQAGIGGTLGVGSSLTYDAYADAGNSLNVLSTHIGSTLSFGPNVGPGDLVFSGATSGGSTATNLFSLTEVVNISATQNGSSSFDASVSNVPEPASILGLGTVLLLVGAKLRRRKKA